MKSIDELQQKIINARNNAGYGGIEFTFSLSKNEHSKILYTIAFFWSYRDHSCECEPCECKEERHSAIGSEMDFEAALQYAIGKLKHSYFNPLNVHV